MNCEMIHSTLHETGSNISRLTKTGANIIFRQDHYSDVIMGTMASQITSPAIVYLTVYSDADQKKHQRSASLAFVRVIHRWPVNSPHKGPVTRKMFPFDDVIMFQEDKLEVMNGLGINNYEQIMNVISCWHYDQESINMIETVICQIKCFVGAGLSHVCCRGGDLIMWLKWHLWLLCKAFVTVYNIIEPILCWKRNNLVELSQHRGCWCLMSLCRRWHWVRNINRYLSSSRNDFNYLHHLNAENNRKIQRFCMFLEVNDNGEFVFSCHSTTVFPCKCYYL